MSTAFTRTPSAPTSRERALVRAIPAARVTELGPEAAAGALAPIASTLTTAPPPARR
jgi:hypothetical protein